VIWHMFDGISWYMVYGCWHMLEAHGLKVHLGYMLVMLWSCLRHIFGILLRHWYI
jgi:hypothetical protein